MVMRMRRQLIDISRAIIINVAKATHAYGSARIWYASRIFIAIALSTPSLTRVVAGSVRSF